jgi:hypothetical protein
MLLFISGMMMCQSWTTTSALLLHQMETLDIEYLNIFWRVVTLLWRRLQVASSSAGAV